MTIIQRNLDGYGAPPIEWARVSEVLPRRLTQAPGTGGPQRHTPWLATINPDGSPLVMPLGMIQAELHTFAGTYAIQGWPVRVEEMRRPLTTAPRRLGHPHGTPTGLWRQRCSRSRPRSPSAPTGSISHGDTLLRPRSGRADDVIKTELRRSRRRRRAGRTVDVDVFGAAGRKGLRGGATPLDIAASEGSWMLRVACSSAGARYEHRWHSNSAWVMRFSAAAYPQFSRPSEVCRGSTSIQNVFFGRTAANIEQQERGVPLVYDAGLG